MHLAGFDQDRADPAVSGTLSTTPTSARRKSAGSCFADRAANRGGTLAIRIGLHHVTCETIQTG